MDLKLIWTARALADLAEIVRHYREDEKSVEAARKVSAAILDRVEVLQTFPDIGPRYPRKDGPPSGSPLLRLYRVDRRARIVYIAHIWHGRQDPSSLEL